MQAVMPIQAGLEPISGYRLRQALGQGGFGQVWEADSPSGKLVALKFLPCGESANKTSFESRGTQMIRPLNHPNLVRIHQVWSYQGYLVVAMELAECSVQDLLDAHLTEFHAPIPADYVCALLKQAAAGLDFLNARQHWIGGACVALQHCDVNPSNMLLFGDTLKLSDFSLTSVLGTPLRHHRKAGSLAFAAPEVFKGRLSDRTDQYGLAVSYCLLRSGQLPFAETPASFDSGYTRPAPNLTMLPEGERAIVARGLAPVPMDRWRTCGEMMEKLAQEVARKPTAVRRPPAKVIQAPVRPVVPHPERERRNEERVQSNSKRIVSWRPLGERSTLRGTARVQDVSITGIALVLLEELKQGITLVLKMEHSSHHFARPVLARVVHVVANPTGDWSIGCSFVNRLSWDELKALV